MKKSWISIITLFAVTSIVGTIVNGADLKSIRVLNEPSHSRVVLDLSEIPQVWTSSFRNSDNRVILKLKDTSNQLTAPISQSKAGQGVLKGVSLVSGQDTLNVSLVATQMVKYNAFSLTEPNRLVVDMFMDYNQKTTSHITDHVSYTNWITTNAEGPLHVGVMVVDKTQSFKLGYVPEGKGLLDISQAHVAAVGLQVLGKKLPRPTIDKDLIVTRPSQLRASAELLYSASQGYSIKEKKPVLQASSKLGNLSITGINKTRGLNDLILYSIDKGTSTGTNEYGLEVTLRDGKVVSVGGNDSHLTGNAFVLSGHGSAAQSLGQLKVGDQVIIRDVSSTVNVASDSRVSFVGGTQVLKNQQYIGTNKSGLRSRSYLGVKGDGSLVAVAMDGQSVDSVGVTSQEGANILKNMGVSDALELTNQGSVDMSNSQNLVHKENMNAHVYDTMLIFP